MNNLTKFASKLYPRWWRERYGDEFTALLEDARPGLGGTLDVLKGALTMQLSTFSVKRTFLIGAGAGLAIGLAVTFFLTPQYSSAAVVSVTSTNPAASNRATADAVNELSQSVLSRPALLGLIRNLNLYVSERNKMPAEEVLEMIKRNIRISASPAATGGRSVPAFELSFSYSDRVAAQKVVSALVSGFIDANVLSRTPENPGNVILELKEIATPGSPITPARGPFALAGMAAGLLLSGLAALILHFRRKRQPA